MAWDSGTYRRDASKANRGKPFEDFINFANEKYQAKGIAVMHKVPTEFIPLRGAHGQVASCKVDRKSCVDYLGRFRDIPVAVEAKHTQGARIDFSAVQDHQVRLACGHRPVLPGIHHGNRHHSLRKFWHESVFYGAVELLESSSRLLGETQENKAKRNCHCAAVWVDLGDTGNGQCKGRRFASRLGS